MRMGAFNVEYVITKDGRLYIMELGPRNGGNLITDALKAATGIDLAAYTVMQAVGEDCSPLCQTAGEDCSPLCRTVGEDC